MKYPIRRLSGSELIFGRKCDSCNDLPAAYELSSNPMVESAPTRFMCDSCLRGWAQLLASVVERFGEEF